MDETSEEEVEPPGGGDGVNTATPDETDTAPSDESTTEDATEATTSMANGLGLGFGCSYWRS